MAQNPTTAPKEGSELFYPSPLTILAWKLAGQPEPIEGATRVMALELHFRDNTNKINKLFAISA
jgi:hypothetical protein